MQARKAKARMIRMVTWRRYKHTVTECVCVLLLNKCGSMSGCVVIIDGETLLTEVNGSSRQEAELRWLRVRWCCWTTLFLQKPGFFIHKHQARKGIGIISLLFLFSCSTVSPQWSFIGNDGTQQKLWGLVLVSYAFVQLILMFIRIKFF